MLFYLELLINWLDEAIVKGAELSGLRTNKHFLTGMFLVMRYYPELKAAAARTDNTLDDKVVDRVYEAAQAFWPTSDPNFPFTADEVPDNLIVKDFMEAEVERLKAVGPPVVHDPSDPDLEPHSE